MPGYAPAESSTCCRCEEEKPAAMFKPDPRMKSGLSSICRPCRTNYGREYRNLHREKTREQGRKRYAAQSSEKVAARKEYERSRSIARHGLTMEQYENLLSDQGEGCAICASPTAGGKGSWHIDHDHSCCPGTHSCGQCVRGLLCHRCNTAIGLMGDDPDWVSAALAYIKEGK